VTICLDLVKNVLPARGVDDAGVILLVERPSDGAAQTMSSRRPLGPQAGGACSGREMALRRYDRADTPAQGRRKRKCDEAKLALDRPEAEITEAR
jgi:hypothetical protein